MLIPLGTGDWESVTENVPRFKLRNMYLVDNPLSPDGVSRLSRPTLKSFETVGTGPVMGIWRQDGTLSGDFLVVSGEELYSVTLSGAVNLIDDLPGEGYCQFAGNDNRAVIVRDGLAYRTDGNTLVPIVMPDALLVGSVDCIDGSFLLSILDSHRFYWITYSEDDPDALSFASAERTPDPIISVAVVSDEIWFIGSAGVEAWSTTGDIDDPYARIAGRVYNEGCSSRDSVVKSTKDGLPCLLWATDTGSVVLAQGGTMKVSNQSVEELLKTASNLRGWAIRHNRTDFYVLTSDQFTLAYDVGKGVWARWDSYGYDNWLAHLGTQYGTRVFAGSLLDGTLWELEAGADDAGLRVTREVSGFVANSSKPLPCARIYLRVNAGWVGDYETEPVIELRWSDDMAATWSDYLSIGMGLLGVYDEEVVIRSLGLIRRPGRVFEFRVTDNVRFRLDYAMLNEDA